MLLFGKQEYKVFVISRVLIKHKESREVYIVAVQTVRVQHGFSKEFAIPKRNSER